MGFEPTISAGERPQTYALDRAATGTGIIIITYYNYIINAQCNYYNSNKGLLEECDKKENEAVTGLLPLLLVTKEDSKTFCPCHVFAPSPPGQYNNDKYPVNIYNKSYQLMRLL